MIRIVTKKNLLETLILISAVALSSGANADNLTLVKHFSSLGGTIDFLPGAWVRVSDDKKPTYYKYEGGTYVESHELPDLIKDWRSMDWADFPFADLGSVRQSRFLINAFVPKQSKINKIIGINRKSKVGQNLVLVCYTLKEEKPDDEMYPDDIYLTALAGPADKLPSAYTQLWTKKLEAAVDFGYMQVQNIQPYGRFLVLFWGQPTGDSFVAGMDVYRLDDN